MALTAEQKARIEAKVKVYHADWIQDAVDAATEKAEEQWKWEHDAVTSDIVGDLGLDLEDEEAEEAEELIDELA